MRKIISAFPSYFSSANSGNGFLNYYSDNFGTLDTLYIVKGGPGCGKSRFMWDAVNYAKEKDIRAELFFCSSDPDSLDGVRFPALGIGILDGTPPHAMEPSKPGCREHIINLGDFWDASVIRSHRAEIDALYQSKKDGYTSVYRYLKAADLTDTMGKEAVCRAMITDKMDAAVSRLLHGVRAEKEPSYRLLLRKAISMQGLVCYQSYEALADTVYVIYDRFGCGHLFLQSLLCQAKQRGISCDYSHNPLNAHLIDAVFLPSIRTSFVVERTPEGANIINMERFLRKDILSENRTEIRFAKKCFDTLMHGAFRTLSDIGTAHFAMEGIYEQAMDFPAKEDFTKAFLAQLF